MTESTSSTAAPIWNTVLRYGGITALAMIVVSLLTYLLDFNVMSITGMLLNFVIAVGVTVGISAAAIKFQRDKIDGGYINYGRGLLVGSLTTAIGLFLSSFWNYVLINFIDPGYVDNLKEKFVNTWGDSIPAEKMDEALAKFDKSGDLMTILSNGVIAALIIGLIAGLIAAAIMKRNPPVE